MAKDLAFRTMPHHTHTHTHTHTHDASESFRGVRGHIRIRICRRPHSYRETRPWMYTIPMNEAYEWPHSNFIYISTALFLWNRAEVFEMVRIKDLVPTHHFWDRVCLGPHSTIGMGPLYIYPRPHRNRAVDIFQYINSPIPWIFISKGPFLWWNEAQIYIIHMNGAYEWPHSYFIYILTAPFLWSLGYIYKGPIPIVEWGPKHTRSQKWCVGTRSLIRTISKTSFFGRWYIHEIGTRSSKTSFRNGAIKEMVRSKTSYPEMVRIKDLVPISYIYQRPHSFFIHTSTYTHVSHTHVCVTHTCRKLISYLIYISQVPFS